VLFQVKNNFNKKTIFLAERLYKKATEELKSILQEQVKKATGMRKKCVDPQKIYIILNLKDMK